MPKPEYVEKRMATVAFTFKILHKKSFSGAFHNIHKNPFLFQNCNIEQGLERYIDI